MTVQWIANMIDFAPRCTRRHSAVYASSVGVLLVCLLTGCGSAKSLPGAYSETADSTPAVGANCLLPGQVRQLGTRLTYLSPRRPVRLDEAECQSRGGQWVVARDIVVAESEPQSLAASAASVEIQWQPVETDGNTVYSAAGQVLITDGASGQP